MNTPQRRQGGFSLIELMISITVALFLIGGVVMMLGNTRDTYNTQSALAQLQDDQRLAMTSITNVVQSAGFFPDPINMTDTGVLTTGAVVAAGQTLQFNTAGQSMSGATNPTVTVAVPLTPPGDTFVARYYVSGAADNVIDCTGQVTTTTGIVTNTFTIDANNNLLCIVGTKTVQLVSNVIKMQIWYGLKSSPTADSNQVGTYVPTADMADADWPNVVALRVQLTFKNPLYYEVGHASQQARTSQTIDFTRVVTVMNKAGVQT